MFTSTSVAQDFSICIRCQYRLAIRRRPRSECRNRLSDITPTRHLTSGHRLLQKESQSVTFEQAREELSPLARNFNGVKPQPLLRKSYKRSDLYSTATLEIDSLGKPTEIIMLQESQVGSSLHALKAEDALENHHVNISPTGMLENIQEENASVDIEGASINIENLKTSWLSQLQNRHSTLTKIKYLQLVNSLQEGFTHSQLIGYYRKRIAKLPKSVLELAHPYSIKAIARSSWVPGCSPFPGRAADHIAEKIEASENALRLKNSVAERIVQVLWNFKVPEEVGELDIRIKPPYFDIILSDGKSNFNSLTETYGVKVNVWQSRGLIRVTSHKDTCCDVFKSIVQTLENIRDVSIYLPLEPVKRVARSKIPGAVKESLIEEIEHVTGTVIRRSQRSKPHPKGLLRKYTIFYLGPDEDGLESAKEKLVQASQSTASKPPFVDWADRECLQGRPRPIEVGSALPVLARGMQWSRWACPIKRKLELPLMDKGPELNPAFPQSLVRSIFKILFKKTLPDSLNPRESDQSLFWSESSECETFAAFGQVAYSSGQLGALPQKLEAQKVRAKRIQALRASLGSVRQFFYGFPGLRSMLQNANPGMQVGEELRIRLRPSPDVLMDKGAGRMFPDIELRIKCDLATKTCEFSSAMLILNQREEDLLLPTETVDIRFCSTTLIASGAKTDPQILNFLESSKVHKFPQQALNLTKTLTLSIPAHSIWKPPRKADSAKGAHLSKIFRKDYVVEEVPDNIMTYMVSNFERWSHMSGNLMGLNFEYAVVAGGKSRQREEIHLKLDKEDKSQLDQAAFKVRFEVLSGIFEKLKSINHAKTTDRNIAASLVSDE